MPKIVTEHEREQTKKSIVKGTKQLIRAKRGIKNITVEDIVRSVGLGKSSFYSTFSSKEACIYEVIENAYADLMDRFETIMQEPISLAERISLFLREVYLAEDGISNYIDPKDYEALLRKLPPEYSEREQGASENVIVGAMELLSLNRIQSEAITVLLDCIDYVATSTSISNAVKEETLDALILSIAEYVERNARIGQEDQTDAQ